MRPESEGQAGHCGQEEGRRRDRFRLSINLGPGQQGCRIPRCSEALPPLLSRDTSQVPAALGRGHLAGSEPCAMGTMEVITRGRAGGVGRGPCLPAHLARLAQSPSISHAHILHSDPKF